MTWAQNMIFYCLLLFVSKSLYAKSSWLEVDISIIGTASQDILTEALSQASNLGAEGILLKLDTPGGALDSTRTMVQEIMAQPIPVVVWVGPSGARAGSAGAFITIASHIAVMAEGTNIGAAHPVQATGKDIEKGEVHKKVENDTKAFMESIAEARNRNSEMAVSFVVNSLSITAKEALENNIIDHIANDRDSLMKKIHGMEIKMGDGRTLTIDSEDIHFVLYEKTIKQMFLEVLSHPNVFYLLFMAGMIGVGFELTHPGSLIPGVIGGIAMILALIATSVLPVNIGAIFLIVASVAFIVAEAYVPSFGILGIGGVIGFIAGSILLIDPSNEQGLRLSWQIIVPTASIFLISLIGIVYLVIRSERSKTVSGSEGMIGAQATVVKTISRGTKGSVRFEGEYWDAYTDNDDILDSGCSVRVLSRNGLELRVENYQKDPDE